MASVENRTSSLADTALSRTPDRAEDTDTLLTPLLRWSSSHPHSPVVAVRDGHRFVDRSAADVWSDVRSCAKALLDKGIHRGDRVAIMAASSLEWFEVDHAIMAVGGVTVPIYETSSTDQVRWILENSGAGLVFVGSDQFAEVVGKTGISAENIVVLESVAFERFIATGDAIADRDLDERVEQVSAEDVATIIYTSGTTGRPKGCVLTHQNLRANVRQIEDALGGTIDENDTALLFLPLAHVLSKMTALYCIDRRIKIAFGTGVGALRKELVMVQPTIISAVPRIFEKVYAKAQRQAVVAQRARIFERAVRVAIRFSRERRDGSVRRGLRIEHALFDRLVYRKVAAVFGGKLRMAFCGGAPLGEHLTSFFDGTGLRIYEGYGLTETSPILTISHSDSWTPGSVGSAVADTAIKVAEDGELMVKGPQVFGGYWQNDEATADSFDADGWFHTGDVGTIDEDGMVRITGRSKDLIVTAAGKNVAPAPLEDLLRPHPLISQAMVIGDGKPFIAALITLDEDGVQDWANQHEYEQQTPVELATSIELRNEIQRAVDRANDSVSRAESIRKFVVLPSDFSAEAGEVTPTLKVKREVVLREHAGLVASLYCES